MDLVKYTAQLDLTDNGCFDTGWRIKQGDYGNSQLMISLVDNGVNAFDSNVIPQINFKRPDGKSVLANMTVEQNVYSYIFAGNELEIAGTVLMDVKFITPQGRTSSASCKFTCVEDTIGIDTTGAGTYYNPVSEVIEEAKAIVEEAGGYAEAVADLQQNKQNKLIAGRNITIDEETNVISASGGGGGGASAAVDVSYDNTTTQMPANNVQDAIDEVFHSVGNGKELIASAISDKGIPTLATDTFAIMAEHIAEIESGGGIVQHEEYYGNAVALYNKTVTSKLTGTFRGIFYSYTDKAIVIKNNNNVVNAIFNDSRSSVHHYSYYEFEVNKDDSINFSISNNGDNSFCLGWYITDGTSGSGTDVSDTTAIENDVKLGKIFHLADGSRAVGTNTDVDISDTTAEAGDVLSGHFFYTKDGVKTLGQYRPPVVPALGTKDVRVNSLEDAGVISGTNFAWNHVVYGLAEEEKVKVIPENIKKDVTILGVEGTFEGASSKFASGNVRLTTSTGATIEVGFKPKQIIVIQSSGTAAAPVGYVVYDESEGDFVKRNGANQTALPNTTANFIGSVTDTGFTLNKVSNASTIPVAVYWAFG